MPHLGRISLRICINAGRPGRRPSPSRHPPRDVQLEVEATGGEGEEEQRQQQKAAPCSQGAFQNHNISL